MDYYVIYIVFFKVLCKYKIIHTIGQWKLQILVLIQAYYTAFVHKKTASSMIFFENWTRRSFTACYHHHHHHQERRNRRQPQTIWRTTWWATTTAHTASSDSDEQQWMKAGGVWWRRVTTTSDKRLRWTITTTMKDGQLLMVKNNDNEWRCICKCQTVANCYVSHRRLHLTSLCHFWLWFVCLRFVLQFSKMIPLV